MIWLLALVVATALVFEFINGFHDTANAIATSVATKVLTPRQAILLAVVTNLLGALWGTAVAKTIASGLVDNRIVTSEVILAALIGAIIWNLITWYYGIPSSSSHALVGGLCGAAFAAAKNDWSVIIWSQRSADKPWWQWNGVIWKIIAPMITSPLLGLVIGFTIMALLYVAFQKARPRFVNSVFGKLQVFSAAGMGFMHGTNDAQKTMGIIALALLSATQSGILDGLPSWLHFLQVHPPPGQSVEIDAWIKIACALTMASGTAVGGWRIIKTLGHKMARLQPIHGFAAETSSSIVIFIATQFGIPVSTTHNISAAIMGVGAAKRFSAVKWSVVEKMVWAWIMTLPCAAAAAYAAFRLIALF